jgi:hypothetical protein
MESVMESVTESVTACVRECVAVQLRGVEDLVFGSVDLRVKPDYPWRLIAGRSVARYRACFGSRRSPVRIRPPR